MRPDTRARHFAAGVLVAAFGSIPLAQAQLPNLSQVTASQSTTGDDSAATTTGNTAKTTAATQTGKTTAATTGTGTGTSSATGTSSGTGTSATSSAGTTATGTSFPSNPLSTSKTSSASGTFLGVITGSAPTLEGVGIPTMVVPYTANAPYMKKSSLPEGTVFIAIGAILAFMAFCVIAWRALVAWSINRSVKRAALASIMASETKNPGGWASNPFKPAGGFYTQAPGGSSLSLGDQLSRHEKTTRSTGNLRNPIPSTGSGLFFSPTASNVTQTTQSIPMTGLVSPGNRSSSFLPAGYYASPSSQIGSSTSPAAPNPPFASPTGGSGGNSPSLAARRMSSQRPLSNMQLAPPASERGNRVSGSGMARPNSGLNPMASASSLHVGTGHGEEGRAPSAYLEDLFEGGANPASGLHQGAKR